MGSSLSSSSSSSYSSSYPSHPYSVPGSFNQGQNRHQGPGQGEQHQGESSRNQMATTSKNAPPEYQRDPQPPQQQQRPEALASTVGTDRPPRYSGVSTGTRTFYVDSRYDYGMYVQLLVFSFLTFGGG
jgi:hypothetical protein